MQVIQEIRVGVYNSVKNDSHVCAKIYIENESGIGSEVAIKPCLQSQNTMAINQSILVESKSQSKIYWVESIPNNIILLG